MLSRVRRANLSHTAFFSCAQAAKVTVRAAKKAANFPLRKYALKA